MKTRIVCLLCVVGALLSGCASFVKGTTQEVKIDTMPQGVKAVLDGQDCITPCILQNVKRSTTVIALTVPDKGTRYYRIGRNFNGGAAIAGNWWNDFLPGMFFDMATGAAYDIRPVMIDTNTMKGHERESDL